jgi:LuxR family maltose regulon positive regulatory protein
MLQLARAHHLGLVQPVELAFLDRLSVLLPDSPEAAGDAVAIKGSEAPSAREVELLSLLDQGLTNQQLADRLSLSLATVKWHLRNLYTKLDVGNRSAALAKARALNLLPR